MMLKADLSQAVDERKAAKFIGVAVQTLRNWRHMRRGPAYLKIGKAVRYRIQDLDAFLNEHRIDPELKR